MVSVVSSVLKVPPEAWVMVKPVMTPLRSWTRGRSQVRTMDVEEIAVATTFTGGPLGTVERKMPSEWVNRWTNAYLSYIQIYDST